MDDELDLPSPPADGLEGLRKALTAERNRNKQLTQELQQYKSIGSPEEFTQAKRILTEELELMQQELEQERQTAAQQLQELQNRIQQQTLSQHFTSAYGNSKGLPQYQEVLAAYLQPRLTVSDNGVLLDGKPLGDAIAGLKEQFPHMFAPDTVPVGSGSSASQGSGSNPSVVSFDDWDAMMKLDPSAVKAGEIVIQ